MKDCDTRRTSPRRCAISSARPARTMPASTAGLNVIELWPELVVGVSDVDAQAIQDACVASWHEGWEPNRAEVEDLAAKARGEIDHDELLRRDRERATC